MTRRSPPHDPVSGTPPDGAAVRQLPRLVLVEPHTLTAWSLSTYLRRWFDVKCTSTVPAARRYLSPDAAALIVSDELPRRSVEALTRAARLANPNIRMVVLVTAESEPRVNIPAAARLEKPFDLSALADLLGVPLPTTMPPQTAREGH